MKESKSYIILKLTYAFRWILWQSRQIFAAWKILFDISKIVSSRPTFLSIYESKIQLNW